MSTVEDVLTTIEGMTVLELSELLKAFEEKFDVTAAAPVAMAVAPAAADGDGGGEDEQSEFDVVLIAEGAVPTRQQDRHQSRRSGRDDLLLL